MCKCFISFCHSMHVFFFLKAAPLSLAASNNSLANLSTIVLSFLFLEASTSHLNAKVCLLTALTSTGTWYVAPPTLLDFTSKSGLTFSIAFSNSSIPASSPLASKFAIAPYIIFSAADFLPSNITVLTNFVITLLL